MRSGSSRLRTASTEGASSTAARPPPRIARLYFESDDAWQAYGWSPLRSLRSGRFKFIEAPRRELYDLERDPFEQQNLYQERRD